MQTKPTLTSQRVWSATDFHTVEPTSATWAASVVTFKYVNHFLANGDAVNIVCTVGASPWNMGAKTITLIDKDTFSVPLVADPGAFPNASPYPVLYNDSRVYVQAPKYSKTFYLIDVVNLDIIGATSTVKIQAKVHEDATWVDVVASISAVGITAVTPYNYMRATFATGSNVSTIYVQRTK